MPDPSRFDELVHAYLDGELDAAQAAEFERLLAESPEYRAQFEIERDYDAVLRRRLRLRLAEPAPAALRNTITAALATPPKTPWYARGLASAWAPRLAMAAVLAVVLLIPALRLLQRVPDVAHAAGARHACHHHLDIEGPLPPCCREIAAGVGQILGEPTPGVAVPDLAIAELRLVRAMQCTFRQSNTSQLLYKDASGRTFSLVLSAWEPASFRMIRWRAVEGVPRAEFVVPVDDPVHHVHENFDVTLWRAGDFACTWTGPAQDPDHAAALRVLQAQLH
jgi:anti-sigma factor RsiW